MGDRFLSGQSSDAKDSPEEHAILGYKIQLNGISDLFLHGIDLREITGRDINDWEKELRGIVEGIKQRQNAPYIDSLLTSCDGARKRICDAIDKLYIASDILRKRNPTLKDRQRFYLAFRECSAILTNTIDTFFKI